jgi:bla regulator protein blaR1
VPFAVLVSAGSQVSWRHETAVTGSTVVVAPQERPPIDAAPIVASESARVDWMPEILWLVWGCGSVATLIFWGRKWTRMHANVRRARRVDLRIAIPVRSAAALFEPGVFGAFRPILLLPEGITEKLTPGQLEAIVAHELCHVRRRDNLATAMHMVVEAVFWFHPGSGGAMKRW